MEALLKSDIFFFITSIAVILVTLLLLLVLYYIVRIVHDIKTISGLIRKESEAVIHDISRMHEGIKTQGLRVVDSVVNFFTSKAKKKPKRKTKKESE